MHLRLYECPVCKTVVLREKFKPADPHVMPSPPRCPDDAIDMTPIGETFLAVYQEGGPITAAHMEGSK